MRITAVRSQFYKARIHYFLLKHGLMLLWVIFVCKRRKVRFQMKLIMLLGAASIELNVITATKRENKQAK